MLVSFDFDNTLKTQLGNDNTKICSAFRTHKDNGDKIHIISSRENTKDNFQYIILFLSNRGMHVAPYNIHLMGSDEGKLDKIAELRIDQHYDDSEEVLTALEGTTTIGINSFTRKAKQDYETYLDEL